MERTLLVVDEVHEHVGAGARERAGHLAAPDELDPELAGPGRRAAASPDEGVVVGQRDRRAPGRGGQLGDDLGRVGAVGGVGMEVQVDHGPPDDTGVSQRLRWSGRAAPSPVPDSACHDRPPRCGHGRGGRRGGAIGVRGPTMKEACGVFGVYAPGRSVAQLTFDGLYALQHRGQESAGMAVSDGETITVVKDMGLVSTVFDERTLSGLARPSRHRAHPLLDPRHLGLEQRPARLPPGRAGRIRPRPQRQPDRDRRPHRAGRDAARA